MGTNISRRNCLIDQFETVFQLKEGLFPRFLDGVQSEHNAIGEVKET